MSIPWDSLEDEIQLIQSVQDCARNIYCAPETTGEGRGQAKSYEVVMSNGIAVGLLSKI
jgi:hypothetical protein